jgi:branched-subunit amino acid transport protein
MNRLPEGVQLFLRLVGPSALAGLSAVNALVSLDADRHASFHVGLDWLAVALCLAVVAWRKNLFPGLIVAVALMAGARALALVP